MALLQGPSRKQAELIAQELGETPGEIERGVQDLRSMLAASPYLPQPENVDIVFFERPRSWYTLRNSEPYARALAIDTQCVRGRASPAIALFEVGSVHVVAPAGSQLQGHEEIHDFDKVSQSSEVIEQQRKQIKDVSNE
ncbi:hypothetical protein HF086_006087 [Spodoptera exigua]|uniref:Uncharacterized protein n=1 Tax=Spodoptera exigua TaxID=7107 RepID=A0A922MQL7_SPOEX|nr:hypothetical protein HF086_006087 [Spodoptera exigua]